MRRNAASNLPPTAASVPLLPEVYVRARQLLAKVTRIDQVKSIHDKAEALRAYAVQARDREMECLAGELRMRSERRAGEILVAIKEGARLSKGAADPGVRVDRGPRR